MVFYRVRIILPPNVFRESHRDKQSSILQDVTVLII